MGDMEPRWLHNCLLTWIEYSIYQLPTCYYNCEHMLSWNMDIEYFKLKEFEETAKQDLSPLPTLSFFSETWHKNPTWGVTLSKL